MSGGGSGQGSNSVVVRQFNERVVLSALRRLGEASKADLARYVNLTQNAAGQIVRGLEAQKLVRENGKRVGLRGQPATLLQLDPAGAYAIGIKLGRRTLDSLLVDFSGTVLEARRHERAFPPPEVALRIVRDDIAALRRAIPTAAQARLAGIGLAMPFHLGKWRRSLEMPEAICAAWDGVDAAAELRAQSDLPVLLENDGNAVAVAELFGGHGRELDDFAVVYIGTATGGGLVLGGQFRRGVTGAAGDVGLMPVGPSRLASAPPPAHGHEILLSRASVSALVRHLRHAGMPATTGRELAAAMSARPDLVEEWVEDCVDALVAPLFSIAATLDLQAIVIDGSLSRSLIGTVVTRLEARMAATAPEGLVPPNLRVGRIGPNAAAMGAAILPLHSSFAPDQELLFGQGGGLVQ